MVREATGVVRMKDYGSLEGVLVEFRGPDDSDVLTSKLTDKKGRFRAVGLSPGTYKFNATKDGFQSVAGVVVVSPKAKRSASIRIDMPIGV
ncbi:MAG TPA: carboxypeptidase-like regulatory domain-containing protein [Terriglobales bacterium]|nr:carboxypeptidase-like regulatory domain-containing protein [Terriglobales bacterium]